MGGRADDPAVLAGLLDNSPYVAALVAADGQIKWANDAVSRIFGYDRDEIIGTNMLDYLDPEWDSTAFESIAAALGAEGLRLPTIFRAFTKDGTRTIVEVWANSQLHDPVLEGMVVYVRRWDERILLDRALETLANGEPVEATMRLLLEAMACETLEADGSVLYEPSTMGFEAVVGAPDLDPILSGAATARGTAPWDRARVTGTREIVAVADLPPALAEVATAAGYNMCWVWPVPDARDGSVAACVVAWRRGDEIEPDQSRVYAMDRLSRIAELRLDREQSLVSLHYAATHDPLTKLANRACFYDALDEVTAPGRDGASGRLGVLYLDLDGFKPVNDRLGHGAGDLVLTEVAKRVSAVVRRDDLVARLGGDEFAVLCRGVNALEELEHLAARLVRVVAEPLEIAGELVSVGVSVGISFGDPHLQSGDELVEAADEALGAAKAAGKGGFRVTLPSA